MKTALITGVTGQDGAYLSELLLSKGYEVHGIKRRASSFNTSRIDHLYQDPHEKDVKLKLHYGDMTDSSNLIRIVQEVQPDEIYNLACPASPIHYQYNPIKTIKTFRPKVTSKFYSAISLKQEAPLNIIFIIT